MTPWTEHARHNDRPAPTRRERQRRSRRIRRTPPRTSVPQRAPVRRPRRRLEDAYACHCGVCAHPGARGAGRGRRHTRARRLGTRMQLRHVARIREYRPRMWPESEPTRSQINSGKNCQRLWRSRPKSIKLGTDSITFGAALLFLFIARRRVLSRRARFGQWLAAIGQLRAMCVRFQPIRNRRRPASARNGLRLGRVRPLQARLEICAPHAPVHGPRECSEDRPRMWPQPERGRGHEMFLTLCAQCPPAQARGGN